MPRGTKRKTKDLEGAGEFLGEDTQQAALDKIEAADAAAAEAQKGDNGGPMLDEAANIRAVTELTAETIELEEIAEKQAAVRGRISSIKKVAEKCGVDWSVVKRKVKTDRRIAKGETGAVVTEERRYAALMRLMASPLHTQFGLFPEEPKGDEANGSGIAEPELAGQHAYSNNEPLENNPHQAGTLAHQEWSLGWKNAESANARSMSPTDGAATH